MTVVMVACDFHRMPYKSINPNKGEGGGTSCPRSSPNGKHNPFCPMPICRQIDIVRRTDLLAGEGLTCHVSCVRMSSASPIRHARCYTRGILVRQYAMRATTRMAYRGSSTVRRACPCPQTQASHIWRRTPLYKSTYQMLINKNGVGRPPSPAPKASSHESGSILHFRVQPTICPPWRARPRDLIMAE